MENYADSDRDPVFARYVQRDVTAWSDNVEAEQLERIEKTRYKGKITCDTAACQRTSYKSSYHRLHARL